MKISYNWLKSYISEIPEAEKIADLLTFKLCEIEDVEKLPNGDNVFDLKILPDRAHDLLSHQGVAREIAGLLGIDFKLPVYKLPQIREKVLPFESPRQDLKENLSINIESPNCRRYMGRIVRNIKVGPSPEWMVKYLEAIGQRSINNIVDATNIVMFDCGQPIHAFDLKQLKNKKIVVREAKEDEGIDLVGSGKITAKLKETDLMITDGENNLAIAGIKGGVSSGVSNETIDILIEVANFNPSKVRKTARRLGIQTEASKRYENDLSPTLCPLAMDEISALIFEMCSDASFEEVVDIYPILEEKRIVSFTSSYISKMLGLEIEDKEIEKILKNYKYQFSHSDLWEVEIPSMRLDLMGPRDFVEEIGRVYGYDKIIPEIPKDSPLPKEGPLDSMVWQKICLAKERLINDGYSEVMTYVFRDKGDLEVMASASDKNFLRNNLTDGLKESMSLNQKNLPLLGMDEVKIFEVGTVFNKKGEELRVAYGDKKNIIEMSLDEFIESIIPSDKNVSSEMHGYNSLEKFLVLAPSRSQGISEETFYPQVFESWSIYPFITRDIAVWVPEGTRPEKLIEIYREFGTELLVREPKLFDSFTKPASTEGGDKKTSLAYRLVFQASDRTLTDDEINKIMSQISEKITSLNWQVR